MPNIKRNCYGNTYQPTLARRDVVQMSNNATNGVASSAVPSGAAIGRTASNGGTTTGAVPSGVFTFYIIDESTGLGIPGAVFELTPVNGCAEPNVVNGCGATEISDADGIVRFPAERCTVYTLTEISLPAAYIANTRSYRVMTDRCGCLFVDCKPVQCLVITGVPSNTMTVIPPLVTPPVVVAPPVVTMPIVPMPRYRFVCRD